MTLQRAPLGLLSLVPVANGLGLSGANDNPDWPRYIRTTDIADERSLRSDVFASQPPEIAADARVVRGDILMTAAGSIGKSTTYNEEGPACYAGFLVRFRPGPLVDGRYVAYWMQTQDYWDQINTNAVKSTIENFSASKYRQMRMPLPSIHTQRRIADFLDDQTTRIDNIITARRQQAEHLNALLASEIETSAGLSQGEVQLRRVVRAWIDYRGGTPRKSSAGVPLVTAGNVRDGEITFESLREFVPLSGYRDWMRRGYPVEGDVLLTTEAPMGQVAQVIDTHIALAQRIILMRADSERCLPRWLYWCLRSTRFQTQLSAHATGSTAPGIKGDRLRGLTVPVPPLRVQASAASHLDDLQVDTHEGAVLFAAQSQRAQELKRSLISAAVSGEFDVSAAHGSRVVV